MAAPHASSFALFDPQVAQHLIHDEGEVIIDEVRRHWVAFAVPVAIVVLSAAFWAGMPLAGAGWWLVFLIGLIGAGYGMYRVLLEHMDRFVITNMRVFRVYGLFSRHTATMPMSRILDIAVNKPLLGRIFGYGHFVFESAAQDQGLRDIHFVARPDERDLTIQRVIQRSGLRSSMSAAAPSGARTGRPGPREQQADGPETHRPEPDVEDGT